MSEDNFNLAANYIQNNHKDFNKDQLLNFYKYYKQATVGQLDTSLNPKPSFYKFNDRAKWDAWNSLGTMSKEEAMKGYLNQLTELKPDWIDSVDIDSKQPSFKAVSRMQSKDELIEEDDKTIEDFLKEGNTEKFKELLTSVDDINELDENGMGLIHWASDRGNESILELILSQKGVNIDLVDSSNQTALHYASSCGHKKIIEILLMNNANKNLLDEDGNSCIDIAFDEEIKLMLS